MINKANLSALVFFAGVLFLGGFLLEACGNSPDKATNAASYSVTPGVQVKSAAAETVSLAGDDSLAILYLTEDEFSGIPAEKGRKLMFEFFSDTKTRGMFSLKAWLTKNKKYTEPPFYLRNDVDNYPLMIRASEENIFANQKIGEKGIQLIKDALRNSNPSEIVAFVPYRDLGSHQIYYQVFVLDGVGALADTKTLKENYWATALGKVLDTNPSPPADDDPD